jgi:peptide chain release factor 2
MRDQAFRLYASSDASLMGTSATGSPSGSSSSSTLAVEISEAKRRAQEAMDLYRRNVASSSISLSVLRLQVSDLETEQSQPGFWDEANAKRASAVNTMLRSKGRLLARLQRWAEWEGDLLAAVDMLRTENLSGLTADDAAMLLQELDHTTKSLMNESVQYELELLLSGPYDASHARLLITCGAGGTESNDWVSDLYRMYTRHCDKMGFRVQVEDVQTGDGYKSVELIVEGDNAYGWLQGEKGAHRLVRLSPFNANNKRQTTFAGVDVAPLLDETVLDVDVPESDLEITTMRAGGKGGQNVNKVNSAVRIKHVPSGLQVKCAQERSQSQNRVIALQRLKSQLLAIAQEQRVQEVAEIRGDQVEASWGAQIRNYVLHPYRLIKDQRTGWETSNVQAFLDGDLEDCIGAYLRHKARQESEAAAASAASDEGS